MKSQYHLRMDSLLLQGLNRGLYIGINEANAIAYGHFTPIVYYHKVWNSYFLLSVVEWWDFLFFFFLFFFRCKTNGILIECNKFVTSKKLSAKTLEKAEKAQQSSYKFENYFEFKSSSRTIRPHQVLIHLNKFTFSWKDLFND